MSKQQDSALEVWLDDDLGPPCLVGTLAHDRGQIRFHYERTGSKTLAPLRWTPASPWTSTLLPKPELGNFGIFLDSSPDRWGQTLMKRREALLAKDEAAAPHALRLGLPGWCAGPDPPGRIALSSAGHGNLPW